MSAVAHRHRRHTSRLRQPAAGPDSLARLVTVAIAVLLVPLAMGGRHPLGQFLLSVAAMAAAGTWLVRCHQREEGSWQLGPLDLLCAGGLFVGLLQVLPLSAAMLETISPNLAGFLPCWSDAAWSLGHWETLSVTPGETYAGLSIFVAQAVLIGCLFQSIDTVDDVEAVLRLVALATGLMAALGVVQYLTSNGNYLWFYEFAFNDTRSIVKGTFSNRNHYASFLAIGAGSLAWWAFVPAAVATSRRTSSGTATNRTNSTNNTHPSPHRRSRRLQASRSQPRGFGLTAEQRLALGLVALAVVVFAVLLSLSRGGAMALAAVGLVGTSMLLRTGRITPAAAGGIVGITLLVGTALTIHGMDRVNTRLDTIWTELAAVFDDTADAGLGGRREVWQAATSTISDFPIFGTGIGSHAAVSPAYMPPTDKTVFTHAENSYLNLGVETGLTGLSLAIVSLLLGFAACGLLFWKGDDREQVIAVALTTGLTAGALHAATDFIWYVPACSTLLMLLGACAVKLALKHLPAISLPTLTFDRLSATALAATAVAVLAFLGNQQLQAARAEVSYEQAIKQSRTLAKTSLQTLGKQAAAAFSPQPADTAETIAADATDQRALLAALDERMASLEKTVAARPDHPRAWADLALSRLEHFGLSRRIAHETIGLVEIRQTVESGGFASAAASEHWVQTVTAAGFADLHAAEQAARTAVTLNPFAGDAWCVLAAVAFLSQPDQALPQACIAQALRVRPHDGQVLFEAAVQAELDGDAARASRLRQQCFAECPSQRSRILNVLLPMMPATTACDLLKPDLTGLRMIDGLWSPHTLAEQMQPVKVQRLAAVYAEAAETDGNARCSLLCEAANLQRILGDPVQAEATLAEAITANPNHYGARLTHVDFALAIGDAETAKRELDWCLLRRPDSQKLQGRVRRLKQLRVEQASMPASLDRNEPTPGERR